MIENEIYSGSVDRLDRDYDEIIQQWRFQTKPVDMIVPDFSYVAQVECENIHQPL